MIPSSTTWRGVIKIIKKLRQRLLHVAMA